MTAAGEFRVADAVGEVDGETWFVPQLPGFTPPLQSDSFATIDQCNFD